MTEQQIIRELGDIVVAQQTILQDLHCVAMAFNQKTRHRKDVLCCKERLLAVQSRAKDLVRTIQYQDP